MLFLKHQFFKQGTLVSSKKRISGDYCEHTHDFFEIEYILNGTGDYIIDGTVYPLRRKMLFFMSPVNFHAIEHSDAEIINVMFPCDLCDAATLFPLFSPGVQAIQLSEEDNILTEKLLMEIIAAGNRNDFAYGVQFLRSLLYKLTTLVPNPKLLPTSHIQSTILYILERFRSNITLQSAADYVGLVPSYLSVLFLQEIGIHFKTYVDNLRFNYAVNLLTSTDMNVAEVCAQSGFCDYANFIRRFKKKYGAPPNAYRKIKRLESTSYTTME